MTTHSSSTSSSDGSDAAPKRGSKDGRGCGDHDQPYSFGRRPRSVAPFPFTPRQFARLLGLRGRIADGLRGQADLDAAGLPLLRPQPVVPVGGEGPGRTAERDDVVRSILFTAGVLTSQD